MTYLEDNRQNMLVDLSNKSSKMAIFVVILIKICCYFIDDEFISLISGIMGELEVGDARASWPTSYIALPHKMLTALTKSNLSVTQFDNGLNRAALSQDVEADAGRYSGVDLGSLSATDLLEDLLAIFQNNHLKALFSNYYFGKSSLQIEGIFEISTKYGSYDPD